MSNGRAAKNGASVYPNDPSGDGAGWADAEFTRKHLAADRANAPYSDAGGFFEWKVTAHGARLSFAPEVLKEFDVCENGTPAIYIFPALRKPKEEQA